MRLPDGLLHELAGAVLIGLLVLGVIRMVYGDEPRTYRAEVLGVVDGDTVDVRLDLGLGVYLVRRVRVAGIDTPELHGPERKRGLEAKAFTRRWLDECREGVTVVVHKARGKYGRLIADLRCVAMSLSDDLVAAGLARRVRW